MNRYELKAKTYLAKENDSKIQEIANKFGIILPSEDLAIFLSVYAPLEEANLNGVRLAKDAVEKSLSTLRGKLADVDHIRPYVIGSILDGWINENSEIVIAFTMYKSVFVEEYAKALELMNEGTLSVSFELTTNPDTIEAMEDDTIRLHDISFSGVGLLLSTKPAYPKAKIYEMASRLLNKVKETNMVFASQIAEELGSNVIAEVENISNSERKENKVMELNDEQKAKIEAIKAQLGDKVKDWNDEDFFNEAKLIEAGYVQVKEEQSVETITVNEETNSVTVEEKENCTVTTTQDDGTKSVDTSEKVEIRTFTQEQVQEQIQPYESKVVTLQSELDVLKAEYEIAVNRIKELEDANAAKEAAVEAEKQAKILADIKDSLKDNPYVVEFKDEDYLNVEKVEKAKLLKENDDLKAKLASKEVVEVIASETTPLVTGHVENITSESTDVRGLINKLGKD